MDLVLPLYTVPMSYVLVVGSTVGFANLLGVFSTSQPVATAKWFLYRIVTDGLAVFLMHNGIGVRALRNALGAGLFVAFMSAYVPLSIYYAVSEDAYFVSVLVFLSLLVLVYLFLFLAPPWVIHRRPALLRLAACNAALCGLFLVSHALVVAGAVGSEGCAVVVPAAVCWFIQPLVLLQALREDSLFWQGLYQGRGRGKASSPDNPLLHPTNTTLNAPLLGIWEIGRATLDLVAGSINRLEEKVVPVIPCGFLQLDASRFFSGGSARVYKGSLRGQTVAIKVLFCLELTPSRVVDFCTEATLLNSLQHSNIVRCLGVSVMPPAICLITEFCIYGSLYDFLHVSPIVVTEVRGSVGYAPNQPQPQPQAQSQGQGQGQGQEGAGVVLNAPQSLKGNRNSSGSSGSGLSLPSDFDLNPRPSSQSVGLSATLAGLDRLRMTGAGAEAGTGEGSQGRGKGRDRGGSGESKSWKSSGAAGTDTDSIALFLAAGADEGEEGEEES
jgi:hypothetical protein